MFVNEAKDSTHKVRLIPFSFNTTQTFQIEFGHNYIRWHTNGIMVLDVSDPASPKQVAMWWVPGQRAGEFGHHTVDENGPVCQCGNNGCLELYAGARAIAVAARAASFAEVVARARGGDDEPGDESGPAWAGSTADQDPDEVAGSDGHVDGDLYLFDPAPTSEPQLPVCDGHHDAVVVDTQ